MINLTADDDCRLVLQMRRLDGLMMLDGLMIRNINADVGPL